MLRLILALIAFVATTPRNAQPENYKTAIDQLQTDYNSESYEQIFNRFSPQMQQALSLEKTKQFFTNLFASVGTMKTKEFINDEEGTGAIYRAKFERAVLGVYLSLDNQNKIGGLLIKPYEEETSNDNRTTNALTAYPKAIAQTIFGKAKAFPTNTQLSIAIIDHGMTKYYGIVKENDSIKAAENQAKVFEIGSITKVFTSTVLASLATANKLKLTDTINAYFPFAFKNNIQLSFERLANHTSGLPRLPVNLDLSDETNPYKSYNKDYLEDYLKTYLKLENDRSKTYSYSNLGAGLLGYTLGLTQKTNFQDLLQKEVFDKYNMTNSYTGSNDLNKTLIKGLDKKGKEVPNWDFDVLFGGGGILSTTEDLAKFANAQFDPKNKELSLTRIPTFTINDQMKIGLGWHILKSGTGNAWYWHNGGTGGYSSSMILDTENKFAVIVLSNVSAFNPKMKNIDSLCFELAKKLNKKQR